MTTQPLRLIVAARLSAKNKRGEQGIGIETQDTYSQRWIDREGHRYVDTVADTRSGTVAPWDRKHLKPWVTEPQLLNRYDGIVAYKNDRLSRGKWSDEVRIRLWAEENAKHLIIVDGPWWPPRHDGDRWQWEAMADAARREWEAITERNVRVQRELRESGALCGKPPYGYATAGPLYGRYLVPTDDGRLLVPVIFTAVAAGVPVLAVARLLQAETGRTWWDRHLGQMIRNPVYKGQRTSAEGKVVHRCEPLVSTELWRAANAALDTRRPGAVTRPGVTLLSGVLRCIRCDDSPMHRVIAGGGGEYYRCSGRGAKRKGCGNMVRTAPIDELVGSVMAELDTPVISWQLAKGTDHAAAIADVTDELTALAAQGYAEEFEDAERIRLRAERKRLQGLPATADEWVPVTGSQTYATLWAGMDTAERRAWLREKAPRIYAGKAGTEQALLDPAEKPSVGSADEWSVVRTGDGVTVAVVFRHL